MKKLFALLLFLSLNLLPIAGWATFFSGGTNIIATSPARICGDDMDEERSVEDDILCVRYYRAVVRNVVFDNLILYTNRLRVLDWVFGQPPNGLIFVTQGDELRSFLGPIYTNPVEAVEGQPPNGIEGINLIDQTLQLLR